MRVLIPHTGEAREDTGLYNAKLGVWLFLAAEAMFFGALVSSFVFLRIAAEAWPVGAEVLPLGLSVLTTLLMLGVACASAQAWAVLRVGDGQQPWVWMWLTVAGAVAAVLLLVVMARLLQHAGHTPASHTFFALYFLLAGLQCLHLLGGALVTLFLAVRGGPMQREAPVQFMNRVECIGLYWQFFAGLWLLSMFLFYMV